MNRREFTGLVFSHRSALRRITAFCAFVLIFSAAGEAFAIAYNLKVTNKTGRTVDVIFSGTTLGSLTNGQTQTYTPSKNAGGATLKVKDKYSAKATSAIGLNQTTNQQKFTVKVNPKTGSWYFE